jgi:hypothetical protein
LFLVSSVVLHMRETAAAAALHSLYACFLMVTALCASLL